MEKRRRISQYVFAVLANSYWLFPWKTSIYQGWTKRICFPGLNCYSCPAAVMACPLGALQNFLASVRMSVQVGTVQLGAYVVGSLGLIGSAVGRMPCGWLCPFGLFQEWLYRIPGPKFGLWRPLRWVPFFFLGVFVIILPVAAVDSLGFGTTTFCKFVCPAGTLEAGVPLLSLEPGLRKLVGLLFVHKLTLLILILVFCAVTLRAFCRTVCPLGAIYGLMNRLSWLRLRFMEDKCVGCRACYSICPTGVSFYNGLDNINGPACIRCMRCYSNCPAGAVIMDLGTKEHSNAANRVSRTDTH